MGKRRKDPKLEALLRAEATLAEELGHYGTASVFKAVLNNLSFALKGNEGLRVPLWDEEDPEFRDIEPDPATFLLNAGLEYEEGERLFYLVIPPYWYRPVKVRVLHGLYEYALPWDGAEKGPCRETLVRAYYEFRVWFRWPEIKEPECKRALQLLKIFLS